MNRIPFDIMLLEADRLICLMATASSIDMAYYYWEQFDVYIEACGWSNMAFDQELLIRIDSSWEPILN
jgi:hypothetical protein